MHSGSGARSKRRSTADRELEPRRVAPGHGGDVTTGIAHLETRRALKKADCPNIRGVVPCAAALCLVANCDARGPSAGSECVFGVVRSQSRRLPPAPGLGGQRHTKRTLRLCTPQRAPPGPKSSSRPASMLAPARSMTLTRGRRSTIVRDPTELRCWRHLAGRISWLSAVPNIPTT